MLISAVDRLRRMSRSRSRIQMDRIDGRPTGKAVRKGASRCKFVMNRDSDCRESQLALINASVLLKDMLILSFIRFIIL